MNVHPTKVEVRFREPQLIHGELLAALRETLNRANLSPTASFAETLISPGATTPNGKPAPGNTAMPGVSGNPPISTGQNASPTITDAEAIDASAEPAQSPAQESRRASLRQAMADFFRSVPPPQPRLSFPESRKEGRGEKEERRGQSTAFDATQRSPLSPLPSSILSSTPSAAPAMQIHDSYIVASCEEGLLIIDQHALHERLIYDDLKRRLAGAPLAGQRLLIPLTLSVSPHEAQALLARGDLLAHIGIEVESFGPATIAIQQFPCLLTHKGVAPDAFIREVMDKLAEDEDLDAEHLLEELLQMLACKAAVKAGTPLGAAEIQALLAARHSVEKAFACPHGRPTMLRMTLRDLEKQFKRS